MNFNIIAIISSLVYATLGHMSMQFPLPRNNGGSYAVWQQNEPMISVHPQICHGLAAESTVRDGNRFTAGDTITLTMGGSAGHNGGHCSYWISTDEITWWKIIDITDCTIGATKQLIMPENLPTECATRCVFAMTWIPASSGACEIYMNCADIQVSGVNGAMPSDMSKNFQVDIINAANYGCNRIDSASKLSVTFAPNFLDYQIVTPPNNNDVIITEPIEGVCYSNPTMALWQSNDIDNLGRCGVAPDYKRCDDGHCCSSLGYCGPEYDGQGYINYDDPNNQYYSSAAAAYAAYCDVQALGDWRVGACANTQTSNAYQKSIIVSIIFSFSLIFIFIF